MIYIKAILLAVVEGATEFLPVSSTGHLVLVDAALSLSADEAFNKAFMLLIQLPAIAAVMGYFRHSLWPFSEQGEARRMRFRLWALIFVAFLPAALVGLAVKPYIDRYLLAPVPVAAALFVGGVVLIAIERRSLPRRVTSTAEIGVWMALFIGLFQCLSLFPGTSRSAATIIGAMVLGANRAVAAEFSFYLAIPTMVAVAVLTIFEEGLSFSGAQWTVLGLGSLVTFLVALGVVSWFMYFIRTRSFALFGWYRIGLAAAVMVAIYFEWLR